MLKICLDHSRIVINNYEPGDCIPLEHFFSTFDPIRHVYNYLGIEYDEETKKLYLPRGIDIPYLQKLFDCKANVNTRHDPMDKVEKIMLNAHPRDDEQVETLRFMLGKGEYEYTKGKSQLAVNLYTGKGKTFCSIATIAYMSVRSMVMTSSLNWLKQWRDSIIKYTNIKPREIFTINGVATIHSLLRQGVDKYKIILASTQTLVSYGKKYGNDALEDLFKQFRIGLRFIDEAHLLFEANMYIDFHSDTYKTYYITATPSRSNEDEKKIYQMYFKNIPSIDLFDPDKDPHTDYYAFRYNSNPKPQDISFCKNKYGLDRNKYTGSYIIRQPNFYNMIRVILNIVLKKKGKALIYIGVNKSIDKVKRWIEMYYPELRGHIGKYNSEIKENKADQLNNKIILSTTKSCGTAMDISGLTSTVVLSEPFKSEPMAIQLLGRTRADNTICIEAIDEGFQPIMKFYYYKKPIYAKYAKSTTETRFKKYELEEIVERIIEDYYSLDKFPTIYMEDGNKVIMRRMENMPFNEYNEKGKKVIMKRDRG